MSGKRSHDELQLQLVYLTGSPRCGLHRNDFESSIATATPPLYQKGYDEVMVVRVCYLVKLNWYLREN